MLHLPEKSSVLLSLTSIEIQQQITGIMTNPRLD